MAFPDGRSKGCHDPDCRGFLSHPGVPIPAEALSELEQLDRYKVLVKEHQRHLEPTAPTEPTESTEPDGCCPVTGGGLVLGRGRTVRG